MQITLTGSLTKHVLLSMAAIAMCHRFKKAVSSVHSVFTAFIDSDALSTGTNILSKWEYWYLLQPCLLSFPSQRRFMAGFHLRRSLLRYSNNRGIDEKAESHKPLGMLLSCSFESDLSHTSILYYYARPLHMLECNQVMKK